MKPTGCQDLIRYPTGCQICYLLALSMSCHAVRATLVCRNGGAISSSRWAIHHSQPLPVHVRRTQSVAEDSIP